MFSIKHEIQVGDDIMNKIKVNLIDGPEDYRVYQRDDSDKAYIMIQGNVSVEIDGSLFCIIGDGTRVINEVTVPCENGSFIGEIRDIPVGIYDINLFLKDKENNIVWQTCIQSIAVGDLYILAGQSNMEGSGKLHNLEETSEHVRCFYVTDKWDIAKDPLCTLTDAVDEVHTNGLSSKELEDAKAYNQYFRTKGAGLGVSFGKAMYEYNKVPVGLIMCAHGGTCMEQWSPDLLEKGGKSLYGAMMRRIHKLGGKVRAVLWYQGESDAVAEYSAYYKERLKKLIQSIRQDIGNKNLPFIYVQLSVYLADKEKFPDWTKIQNDQLEIEKECTNTALIASIDLSVSDPIHIDAVSHKRLGRRLALAARRICFNDNSVSSGPRVKDMMFEDRDRTILKVTLGGVNGTIRNVETISGFYIINNNKRLIIKDYRIYYEKDIAVVLHFDNPVPEDTYLWYGKDEDLNPLCTLIDERDLPLPVFGPVKL